MFQGHGVMHIGVTGAIKCRGTITGVNGYMYVFSHVKSLNLLCGKSSFVEFFGFVVVNVTHHYVMTTFLKIK